MHSKIIVVCKRKLVGTDSVLPILMEVKALHPHVSIHCIFPDQATLELIRQNYHIWAAIRSMNSAVTVVRSSSKLATCIRTMALLIRLLCKNIIIMKFVDNLPRHRLFVQILKKFSKCIEMKCWLYVATREAQSNTRIDWLLHRERRGKTADLTKKFLSGSYDYLLSSLPAKELGEILDCKIPREKVVEVGYYRRLPEWERFVNEVAKESDLHSWGAYFLYILGTLGNRKNTMKEPDMIELVGESLIVLKQYNDRIMTVFKPHPTTNLQELQRVLREIRYSNYVIDFSHPMVLSSKARFVFGNMYSTTMFDAYYQGKPIVEYCQYDPELYERVGKQSMGGKCCDFFIYRDKKGLEKVIQELIKEEVCVNRDSDFIEENFRITPRRFFDFWANVLHQ